MQNIKNLDYKLILKTISLFVLVLIFVFSIVAVLTAPEDKYKASSYNSIISLQSNIDKQIQEYKDNKKYFIEKSEAFIAKYKFVKPDIIDKFDYQYKHTIDEIDDMLITLNSIKDSSKEITIREFKDKEKSTIKTMQRFYIVLYLINTYTFEQSVNWEAIDNLF